MKSVATAQSSRESLSSEIEPKRPGGATRVAEAAAAPPQIRWFDSPFQITHYTFALENDPIHANSPLVQAPGLAEPHRESFLFGDRGIMMQGTGQASDGRYITIDWNAGGPQGRNTHFTYGVGGTGGTPVPWKTVASDPSVVPTHSRVVIEEYQDKGEMEANDTGGAITGRHLDLFIGGATIAEAFALGTKTSRVGIVTGGRLQGQDAQSPDNAGTTGATGTNGTTGASGATGGATTAVIPTAAEVDAADLPGLTSGLTSVFQSLLQDSPAAAKRAAHDAASAYRTAHDLAPNAVAAVPGFYGRAYTVAGKLEEAQAALTAGRYDAALTAARSAEQIAMEIQAQNVVPGELLEQVVAAARTLQQKAEEEKRRTPTISDRPGDVSWWARRCLRSATAGCRTRSTWIPPCRTTARPMRTSNAPSSSTARAGSATARGRPRWRCRPSSSMARR
jgi:3D (Asp-Asp-Asp) domain-containing protein